MNMASQHLSPISDRTHRSLTPRQLLSHARSSSSLALVSLALLFLLPCASSYTFHSECAQPTSDSCPTCCKNLRNLAPAGDPARVFRNVKNVDKCISLCANHTFYGLSNRFVCGCFDDCSVIEVPPSPFTVVAGYIKNCLSTCFNPDPSWSKSQCPEHSTRLLGSEGTCCCKAPFDRPVYVNGMTTCVRPDEAEAYLDASS